MKIHSLPFDKQSSHCSSKVCSVNSKQKKKKNNTIKSNGKNLTEIVKSERDKEIQKSVRDHK